MIGGLSAGSHASGYETTSMFASFWIALDSIPFISLIDWLVDRRRQLSAERLNVLLFGRRLVQGKE